jgi:hypothetical protein
VVLALVLLLGGVVVSLLSDLLWFRSVDYTEVFTTVLTTRLLLFVGFGLLMAVLVGANVAIAYRVRPPFRPMSLEQQNLERYRVAVEPFLRSILLLAAACSGCSPACRPRPVGDLAAVAQRHRVRRPRRAVRRDVSYFAFTYPFQRFVLGFLLTAVVLSLIAAAVVHYLFGGVRLQTVGEKVSPAAAPTCRARRPRRPAQGVRLLPRPVRPRVLRARLRQRAGLHRRQRRAAGEEHPHRHRAHLRAAVLRQHRGAQHPAAGRRPRAARRQRGRHRRHLPGLHPAVPGQPERDPARAAVHPAQHRGDAGGVRHRRREVTPYQASQDATPEQLREEASQVNSARLLDPNELAPTFEQLQRRTFYFGVNDSLDIDRYEIDGEQQDFVVAAREVDIRNLASNQRSWINERLAYTHGNGLIAAPADVVDDEGRPRFVNPEAADSPLSIEQPRIYFGELSPSYSIVNTDQPEIDGPIGGSRGARRWPRARRPPPTGRPSSTTTGRRRAAVEHRPQAAVRPGLPRAQPAAVRRHHRPEPADVHPRAARARGEGRAVPRARHRPLPGGGRRPDRLDRRRLHDEQRLPVLAAHELRRGDDRQPERRRGGLRQQVNYVRNSVKATVDAYDGTVTLYEFGEPDPVLRSWNKAFGGDLVSRRARSATSCGATCATRRTCSRCSASCSRATT